MRRTLFLSLAAILLFASCSRGAVTLPPPYADITFRAPEVVEIVKGEHVKTVRVERDKYLKGEARNFIIELDQEGAARFAAFTEANLHKQVTLEAGGTVLLKATVQEKIAGGKLSVAVLNAEEAKKIAKALSAK